MSYKALKNLDEKYFSDKLAWLLSKNDNHGLNTKFRTYFIELILKKLGKNIKIKSSNLEVIREYFIYNEDKNKLFLDLLLFDISTNTNNVIVVENKFFAPEKKQQLDKYKKAINLHFKNFFNKRYSSELFQPIIVSLQMKTTDNDDDSIVRISWFNDILPFLEDSLKKRYSSELKIFIDELKGLNKLSINYKFNIDNIKSNTMKYICYLAKIDYKKEGNQLIKKNNTKTTLEIKFSENKFQHSLIITFYKNTKNGYKYKSIIPLNLPKQAINSLINLAIFNIISIDTKKQIIPKLEFDFLKGTKQQ